MVLVSALAGCGQSGPLYLPDNPPESQKPRAQRSGAAAQVPGPPTAVTPSGGTSPATVTPGTTR